MNAPEQIPTEVWQAWTDADWKAWVAAVSEPETAESYQQSAIAEHQSMNANGSRG